MWMMYLIKLRVTGYGLQIDFATCNLAYITEKMEILLRKIKLFAYKF